jgi:hypothetical protein
MPPRQRSSGVFPTFFSSTSVSEDRDTPVDIDQRSRTLRESACLRCDLHLLENHHGRCRAGAPGLHPVRPASILGWSRSAPPPRRTRQCWRQAALLPAWRPCPVPQDFRRCEIDDAVVGGLCRNEAGHWFNGSSNRVSSEPAIYNTRRFASGERMLVKLPSLGQGALPELRRRRCWGSINGLD